MHDSKMRLEWVDPHTLLANPLNPRKHPGRQREMLSRSLDSLGWLTPLVVNERTGNLLDGHMRRDQAVVEGVGAVPVIMLDIPEDQEPHALGIIDSIGSLATIDDDKSAELAKMVANWDTELASLMDGELDLGLDEDAVQAEASKYGERGHELALVPGESYNYVTLLFRTELDWVRAQTHFGLVKKECVFSNKVGISRVVDGAEYLREHATLDDEE